MIDANLILGLGALLLAPIGAFFAATRKLSGRIATSDAGELWSESASIREDYRQRLAKADARQTLLEDRVAHLEEINQKLYRENFELKQQISNLMKKLEVETNQDPKS